MVLNKRKIQWFVFTVAALTCVGTLFLSAHGVSAQEVTGNGLEVLQETSGLGSTPFATIIARIIRVILSILGIVTLGFIIFGGFIWMTAGGSEEKIDQAKKTITNGVIGLVITLSAFAITQFVMSSLSDATGTKTGFNTTTDDGGNIDSGFSGGNGGGVSTSGGLQVKTIVPKGAQQFANLQVSVLFTGIIDETTVAQNIKVTDGDGAVPGTLTVKGDSVSFVPSAACPVPHTSKKCFTAGNEYTVTVTGGRGGIVSATTKKSLNCTATSCIGKFVAGDKIDVTGPVISNTDPKNNDKISTEQVIPIQALISDDNAVALGRVSINGVVLETVSASGLQEFLLKTNKFNTKGDAANKEYTIALTAEDIAGNATTLSLKVKTAPAHCFDNKTNFDEIDIDCGAPAGSCPVCTNVACKKDLDCANGATCDLIKNSCVALPAIKSVQPQDGAPGTFVTIGGEGFGTQANEVVFLGDRKDTKDDKVAGPACVGGWGNTQVVVQVPEGAVSGPIQIKNAAGSQDVTDDADGLKLSKFVVNDIERPGLCSISPTSGLPVKTKVTISGNDYLSDSALERKLFIGGYLIDKAAWGEAGANTVTGFIPPFDSQKVSVQVTIKSIASNPLEFFVEDVNASVPAANISSLELNKGPVGQYVTVKGAGFGTTPNKVYFVVVDAAGKLTSDQTPADFNFPQQCAKTFWKDTQIVIKVPQLPKGTYAVVVQPFGKTKQSSYKLFTITEDTLGPQVCALITDTGPADGLIKVALYGENFGKDAGAVIFNNKFVSKQTSGGSGWTNNSATVTVPAGVETGEVRLVRSQTEIAADTCAKNAASCSNPMVYTVLDCRLLKASCAVGTMCCGNGSCQKDCAVEVVKPVKGVFAWCFSTGDTCDVVQPPRVTEECGVSAGKVIPSPSPSAMWPSTAAGGACGNAMITVKFTQAVDPQTVTVNAGSSSSLLVEECSESVVDDAACEKVAAQPLELSGLQVQSVMDEKNAGLFVVPKGLKASTRYKVTLSNSIIGADSGLPLVGPDKPKAGNDCKPSGKGVYCYFFTTSEKQGQCDVDSVAVAPSAFKAATLGLIADPVSKTGQSLLWAPLPSPADKCQVLDPSGYSWSWTPAKKLDTDFDFVQSASSLSTFSPFVAKAPTAGKKSATISVTETASGKSGTGTLSIDLGIPVLTEECSINGPRSPSPSSQWGGEICADAPLVVEFNQPVVNKVADGKEGSLALKLWECTGTVAGKECESVVKPEVTTGFAAYKFSDTRFAYAFQPVKSLAKGVNYLAEIPVTTKGDGVHGKQMEQKKGCRAGVAYCFTFKTTTDDTQCKINSVEVSPFSWNAIEYGVQQTYVKGDLVDQMWHSQAFGKNQCVWLKDNYKWSWYLDKEHQGYAAINPAPAPEGEVVIGLVGKYWSSSPDQNIAAYKETKQGEYVRIIAAAEGIEGKGSMSIAFPTPTILSYQPSACGGNGVCVGSAPSVEFSVAMNAASLSENSYLYECPPEKDGKTECAFTDAQIPAAQKLTASLSTAATGSPSKKSLYMFLPSKGMKLNTRYRVVIAEGARSTAEKKFSAFNYPEVQAKYFSWTYVITKDQCAPKSIIVYPISPIAQAEGDKKEFAAHPYSAPDSCYPEGQFLDPSKLKWEWSTSDSAVANFTVATTTSRQTFVMKAKGVVDLKDNSQTALINASTGGVQGISTWKLSCSSYKKTDCPGNTWPGADHCCHVPPKVEKTYPIGIEKDICRNTLVTIDVTDSIAPESVSSSSVRLGFASTNPDECNAGTIENGYCFGQISYTLTTVNTKNKEDIRSGRVILNLNEVLPANRMIKLRVRAVGADNPELVGLRSTVQVPIDGIEIEFKTDAHYCELTDVKVFPEETTFTKGSDMQNMYSYGLSKQGNGLVPISSIANVYTWGWSWFTNSDKIAKYKGETSATTSPNVIPGGMNGQTTVSAMATITKDTIINPKTEGRTRADSASVEAALCELPWFPQNEPALTNPVNVLEKYSFDFWYCRFSGKTVLPKLVAVKDSLSDIGSTNFTTQDSFRLVNAESGGAIGFRIEKNLKQYSVREWYYQKQFTGDIKSIDVDGFNGIRVGNTVYVGFGNKAATGQFTNILVISLSEPASAEMQNIFDQFMAPGGMQFVKNVKDVGLCYTSEGPTNTMCSTNSQCESSADEKQFCNVEQSKFRRDAVRVVDSSVMVRAIDNARAIANGLYPIIPKDTFIPGLTSSKWPSWNSFITQLGIATVVDPINEYVGCEADADAATCWSVKNKKYQCGPASSVYHYLTIESGKEFALGIPLEQNADQQKSWQGDFWPLSVKPKISASKSAWDFCTSQAIVPNTICGDGALGGKEQCDPAGSAVSGESAEGMCGDYGKFTAKCSSTCQIENIQCVNLCGDGIKQGPEECDDGAKYNGQYNHCGKTCKLDNPLGSCGNGEVDNNEVCDIGTPVGRTFMFAEYNNGIQIYLMADLCTDSAGGFTPYIYDKVTKQFSAPTFSTKSFETHSDICKTTDKIGQCDGNPLLSCIGNSNCPTGTKCIIPVVGTKYAAKEVNSCNWNCKSLGAWCGDNIVNAQNGEECDGDVKGTNGIQCTNVCTKECKWANPVDKNAAKKVPICDLDKPGDPVAMKGCGDGVLNPSAGEECDLGNFCGTEDPTKISCTAGGTNGVECIPQYGTNNSCQYCTASCKKGYKSGGFCGDGNVTGPEVCDKLSFGQVCDPKKFDYHSFVCTAQCLLTEKVGSCMSCAINTTAFTKAKNIAPLAVYPDITLLDPTIGWLPGFTGVEVIEVREKISSSPIKEFAVNPTDPSKYFFMLAKSVIAGDIPVKRVNTIALDANAECRGKSNMYTLNFIGDPTSKSDSLRTVSKNETALMSQIGGAFDYVVGTHNFTNADNIATPRIINVNPWGKYDEYRIVLAAPEDAELQLLIDSKSGTQPFGPGIPKQYIQWANSDGLVGKCKPANGKSFSILYVDSTERKRISGCIDDMPFAEYDRAAAYKEPYTEGKFLQSSVRHIVSIRKNGSGNFYDAIYQVYVNNHNENTPLTLKKGDLTVWQNKNGTWIKKNTYLDQITIEPSGGYKAAFHFVGNGDIVPGVYNWTTGQ